MLGSTSAVAFVPSADLDRSRLFFTDSLGLTVEGVTEFACVLRSGETLLRVTKVDDFRPQPFTVLGWQVRDIHAVMAGLAAKGVSFTRYDGMNQDADGVWTTPGGDLVAWFADPDGNTLSLTQLVRPPTPTLE